MPLAARSFRPSAHLCRRTLLASVPLVLIGSAPAPGHLEIDVGNVRGATGTVHVDICTEAQFLGDCPRSAEAPARIGVTRLAIEGLPPGRYAAQVYYDENGNHRVDRMLFGIPREGVGFSNDARIRLGPPRWADAVFSYGGQSQAIRLSLRYFVGPNAPTR